ncbi:MAG: rhodanese-like domain-containing protein [Actinomycetia bacterium]|nr:rhodanese-like domain-containing protein [Actinomycetes bacterium]
MAVTSIHTLVSAAKAEIDNISPAEAKRRVAEEGALILDIRDVRELQREGVIPGVMHAPRGMLEFWVAPDSPYFKSGLGEDREYILHCASGWRSALSCKVLSDMGLPKVSHIETGFTGWRDDGFELTDYDTWKSNRPAR